MKRQSKVVATGIFLGIFLTSVMNAHPGHHEQKQAIAIPELPKEFRGAWVASVHNIDWPSKPGLPVAVQKKELLKILNKASELKLNAIVLQVRPACDVLYQSPYEPWSYYLTGTMGKPPKPFYDPLDFAIREAHARGLELHAWFNPFRAKTPSPISVSRSHVSRQKPKWIRKWQKMLWLDPGEAEVREYVLKVMLDVVRRYDVDGIHIDDYFYPYPEKTKKKNGETAFPDDKTWKAYVQSGGTLSRGDWRRSNVNRFIQALYQGIKKEKPWVKFGISPFGIWRPGNPKTVQGKLDAYGHLYADSRHWLRSGWCDYFSPQLYWPIEGDQPFNELLRWWNSQNIKQRHLWPGIASSRVGSKRKAEEMTNQIHLTRRFNKGTKGHIHWSVSPLMENKKGLSNLLKAKSYEDIALVPTSNWLAKSYASQPKLQSVKNLGKGIHVFWKNGPSESNRPEKKIRKWIVQSFYHGKWHHLVLPENKKELRLKIKPEIFSLKAVDRFGQISRPLVLKSKETQLAKK